MLAPVGRVEARQSDGRYRTTNSNQDVKTSELPRPQQQRNGISAEVCLFVGLSGVPVPGLDPAYRFVNIRMSDCRTAFSGRPDELTAWKGRPTLQIMADTAMGSA